ncbi:hypothetical protein Celgi_0113 [Cellulomonas gilvus ATCC 13127]|uniref:1,4-beta-xylanase n=1 Tax=Cellulomonas gilvus (strain ATCC 13127 / NRRL B-14078) TaxID=593907 RepID=F8A2S8_CELGA|nr:hypothetical protein Celgi_0113 [Cellulomonas gilvus ATCC 13127]
MHGLGAARDGERDGELPGGYVAGMTWGWTGVRGTWTDEAAAESMRVMVDRVATTWTAVTFAAYQDTAQSVDVHWRDAPTVTEDEVRHAIRAARALGQHVLLKPVVNCADGTWRAHINFFDHDVPCEPKWSDWFRSYGEFVVHYARVAAEEGCEMFSVGCEMVQTDRRADEWRALVAQVREVYPGLVTYNCDKYQEDRVTWWDAVDVISSSGYYPLGDWENQLDRIEPVVATHGKPFVFLEAGCPSRTGSSALPNDWGLAGEPDGEAQADWYREMLASCARREWVQGFVLWDWPAHLYDEADAATNDDYCPFGKPAEAVIRQAYLTATGRAGG